MSETTSKDSAKAVTAEKQGKTDAQTSAGKADHKATLNAFMKQVGFEMVEYQGGHIFTTVNVTTDAQRDDLRRLYAQAYPDG